MKRDVPAHRAEGRSDGPPTSTVRQYVKGRVRINDPRLDDVIEENRVALCRCSASHNKPFCDKTHRATGFRG